MLKKTKTISLDGRSVIGNVEVARFTATIPTDPMSSTSINTYVSDQAAYRKSIKQVRQDADAFRSLVRDEEDKIFAEPSDSFGGGDSVVKEVDPATPVTTTE